VVSGTRFHLCPDLARAHAHILKNPALKPMARNEPLSSDDDGMPVSRAFKFFMNIQLALVLFLALCWLYDRVWSGPSGTSLK
jgi:hypothetical protein